jgi:inosose dehydratase
MSAPEDLSRLRLGTAPDSWGVWFAEDPHQVSWRQYLDELPKAGYVWTELGPQGFLPQDPARLRDELDRRGLRVCGGTVFAALHQGKEALDTAIDAFSREARLLTAVGARYLVHLPEQYTDMHTGAATDAAQLDAEHWSNLVGGSNELGRVMGEEFGVELVFHPHADTHVDTQERIERFLTDTDPRYVNLCLDTGHIAYCNGDNADIVRRFPDRVSYVHLKQVDPEVRERVRRENLSLAQAVPLGVMVEPPYGVPEMPTLLAALADLGRDIFCVIEQDLYPVEPDIPLPIAARTAGYFVACGLGPVRRWPYRSTPPEKGQAT